MTKLTTFPHPSSTATERCLLDFNSFGEKTTKENVDLDCSGWFVYSRSSAELILYVTGDCLAVI